VTRVTTKSSITGVLAAITVGFLVAWFIQHRVNPYQGRIIQEKTYNKYLVNYFKDLNNNSLKERIQLQDYSNLGRPMVKVLNPGNRNYLGIWNLNGEILKRAPLLFSDYDRNGHMEIYAFSRSQDSIFIYGIDYRKENQYLLEKMFVAKTRFFEDKIDVEIKKVGKEDMNEDGFDELYFAIDAGFSMIPRRIYAIDVKNRRVHSSPKAGVRFKRRGLKMADINNDGSKEILASTHASNNYRDTSSYPYNDNSSWLMVFDKNLSFLFEPKKFPGAPSSLRVFPYQPEQKTYLVALHQSHDRDQKIPSSLMLFSPEGRQLKKIDLLDIKGIQHSSYFASFIDRRNWKRLFIATREGQVFYFNEHLQMVRSKQLPVDKIFYSNFIELYSDRAGREIFIPNSDGFLITNTRFDKLLQIEELDNSLGIYHVFINRENDHNRIYAQDGRKSYEMALSPNWLYAGRWWLAGGTSVLMMLILYLQRLHARKRKARMINRKLRYQEAEKQRLAKDLHSGLFLNATS